MHETSVPIRSHFLQAGLAWKQMQLHAASEEAQATDGHVHSGALFWAHQQVALEE